MWLATASVWIRYTWCEFGTCGWSLQWPATSAGLQPYAFLEASPLTLRTMGISLAPVGKISPTQSPTATAWLSRTHLLCISWPCWECELWHTLPPVCSGDSLSVQSTFSFSWLPVVAIGSLILSLEQLSNPVLMQSLELMCNCVESCRKAWNCLPRGWRLGCVTSVGASDIDPYPLSTCCYLLFLFVRLSCGFPMYRSLRYSKDMKVPVVRKSKANVSPFICVFRSEMKGLCIWKYEHFSPSLVSLALICSLKCIIWNLYMDIDFT